MDSSDDPRDPTASSNDKFKALMAKTTDASLKARFYENYCRRQLFSLPDSIMHYIAKNPKTPEIYQKMVQCCKHFFVKNPALVIQKLCYNNFKEKWTTSVGRESFTIDLDNIGCKLWITQSVDIFIESSETDMQNLLSSIVPRIFRCDAKYLSVANQAISYEDYCLLSSCAERIDFYNITVKNEDGSITPLEKLIEVSHNLEHANFFSDTILSNITQNTFQELIKLPHFSKLKYLTLNPIPETFNLDAFYICMKANEFTSFHFTFANSLSDGYKKRLEKIIDEILDEDGIDFMHPYINYDGIDPEKYDLLSSIYNTIQKHNY